MDTEITERRIPLYRLLPCRNVWKQLDSFTQSPVKCNFTVTAGWRGKMYVDKHEVDPHMPQLRLDELLDVFHLKITDTVTLTEEQYKDFKTVSADCMTKF